MQRQESRSDFFFFNDTATTEIYTLSLHDALPISWRPRAITPSATHRIRTSIGVNSRRRNHRGIVKRVRSEEHTSELQSRQYLVCRLLLEKNTTKCPSYVSTVSQAT